MGHALHAAFGYALQQQHVMPWSNKHVTLVKDMPFVRTYGQLMFILSNYTSEDVRTTLSATGV